MHITLLPDSIETLTFEASPERSAGLHVSTIIKSLCSDLDPKRFSGGPMDMKRINMGFTFERVLETAFQARRDNIFRPGEITLDGVAMSPDGIDPDGWWLEEFKATWMSEFDAPESPKYRHWFWQMEAYCLALGASHARLRTLFVNGDYRSGYQPTYRVWEIEFTDEDLQENWKMLMSHARQKGLL